MNPNRIIAENTSQNPHWRQGAFLDTLHESHRWDIDEYWKLEWSLYVICNGLPRPPDGDVFRIFSYVMLVFSCHFDPNDGFVISNLDGDSLISVRERFQLVFEGYFRNAMPDPAIFDETNPLLGTEPKSTVA